MQELGSRKQGRGRQRGHPISLKFSRVGAIWVVEQTFVMVGICRVEFIAGVAIWPHLLPPTPIEVIVLVEVHSSRSSTT